MLKKIPPEWRQIFSNTIWLFSDKIFQLGLGLLVGVWVARYLGPKDFGLYNYVIAIVGFFAPLAKLGLDNIVVRDIARDLAHKDETLGTGFVLKVIASFVALILAIAVVWITKPQETSTILMVTVFAAASIFKVGEIVEFWFQAQVLSKYAVWARNSAYILVNVIKVIFIYLKASLFAFVGTLALEQILTGIFLLAVYQLSGSLLQAWRFSWARARVLIKDSWPLILSGIVIIFYMRIDQIMIEYMVGSEQVGIYSAAVKISELWYFVPISLVNSMFPSVVQAKELGEEIYLGRLQKLFNIMALLGYGVALPTFFLSPWAVNLIYGPKYAASADILTIHIWAGLFVSLGVARETWLTTEGLMTFSAATTAVGAVVNVILNLLLIKPYGGLGASIATVVAQIFASYIAGAFYPQTRAIFKRQTQALFLLGWFKKAPV